MVVISATQGCIPAWDGDDDDMTAVAGAIVVTAFKEEPAGDTFIPLVIMIM